MEHRSIIQRRKTKPRTRNTTHKKTKRNKNTFPPMHANIHTITTNHKQNKNSRRNKTHKKKTSQNLGNDNTKIQQTNIRI